jgi:hypothetical protein
LQADVVARRNLVGMKASDITVLLVIRSDCKMVLTMGLMCECVLVTVLGLKICLCFKLVLNVVIATRRDIEVCIVIGFWMIFSSRLVLFDIKDVYFKLNRIGLPPICLRLCSLRVKYADSKWKRKNYH